ncbi:MAG: hypothetical protein V7K12_29740, partial [Nostoc sp.]
TAVLLRSGMMGNYHVPFWRAVEGATPSLTLILRAKGIRILSTNTAGHAEIQACGEAVRLVGTCTKKRVSMKQESPATPLCG